MLRPRQLLFGSSLLAPMTATWLALSRARVLETPNSPEKELAHRAIRLPLSAGQGSWPSARQFGKPIEISWYGHSLSELGRYGESAAALQTARGLVTTEDTRAFVFQCQGDLEYGQGRYAKAAEFYRDAVAEGVGDWALIMLGRVLFRLAATDEAERCLRQAVAMKGSHPATALYELGRILRSRSELFEARRVLKQALALEPHDDVRECLADVERAIRLQSPAGGRPKLLPPRNSSS
jgi:tetratricopeptide (TPR) repeat protein